MYRYVNMIIYLYIAPPIHKHMNIHEHDEKYIYSIYTNQQMIVKSPSRLSGYVGVSQIKCFSRCPSIPILERLFMLFLRGYSEYIHIESAKGL